MSRQLTYSQAILEATDQCMAADDRVYVIGLGVTDPKGTFGTTLGLEAKYGSRRIFDMPTAENGMTGVCIGSALVGMRPIMTHQRVDFSLLAFDQIINNASKWRYMFGGQHSVPIVIRMVIGRGWGQGPQHSQSFHAMFAHVPGLKVLTPATPHDAKGLLVSAIEDDDPVIFLEQRWLHQTFGPVPEERYRVPIGKANTLQSGEDVTIVASSYMVLQSLRAAEYLAKDGIRAEVVDLRSLKPLDSDHILASVGKTGRLVVADDGWRTVGFAAEIMALVTERLCTSLKANPRRVTYPDVHAPTSHALTKDYYPRAINVINAVRETMGLATTTEQELGITHPDPLDVPDKSFTGPF